MVHQKYTEIRPYHHSPFVPRKLSDSRCLRIILDEFIQFWKIYSKSQLIVSRKWLGTHSLLKVCIHWYLVRLCILAYPCCNRLQIYTHTVPDGLMIRSHIGVMDMILLGKPTHVLCLSQTGVKLHCLQWNWCCLSPHSYMATTPRYRS